MKSNKFAYLSEESFLFTENFTRITFPNAWDLSEEEESTEQVTMQVTEQVGRLLQVLTNDSYSTNQILELLGLKHRPTFLYDYLQPAMKLGFIEMTIPDKPNSRMQKYRLTLKGRELQEQLKNNNDNHHPL